ncbi:MAG: polyketide cyclase [Acidimicrobiales bacterium]|nr:polyketide cyclase [Acidimicrobiales bacterium]
MSSPADPALDLTITRVIRAPRSVVWNAWTDPASFEEWWVPAPAVCKVTEMELRPGGAFVTQISEDGGEFMPHMNGCFLAIEHLERIVFTNSLVGGWRPAQEPFMTAKITMDEHPLGTEYVATVLHRSAADRTLHEEMGFSDGWGTVLRQLAELVEPRAARLPGGAVAARPSEAPLRQI